MWCLIFWLVHQINYEHFLTFLVGLTFWKAHQPSLQRRKRWSFLEALAVYDAGTRRVILLLADPHLLEGGQGGQDGAADPDGVLPLWGSNDLEVRRENK